MEIKASVRVTNKYTRDSEAQYGAGFAPAAPIRSSLTMYAERPTEELTLTDFEVSALDRLAGEGTIGRTCVALIRVTARSPGTGSWVGMFSLG